MKQIILYINILLFIIAPSKGAIINFDMGRREMPPKYVEEVEHIQILTLKNNYDSPIIPFELKNLWQIDNNLSEKGSARIDTYNNFFTLGRRRYLLNPKDSLSFNIRIKLSNQNKDIDKEIIEQFIYSYYVIKEKVTHQDTIIVKATPFYSNKLYLSGKKYFYSNPSNIGGGGGANDVQFNNALGNSPIIVDSFTYSSPNNTLLPLTLLHNKQKIKAGYNFIMEYSDTGGNQDKNKVCYYSLFYRDSLSNEQHIIQDSVGVVNQVFKERDLQLRCELNFNYLFTYVGETINDTAVFSVINESNKKRKLVSYNILNISDKDSLSFSFETKEFPANSTSKNAIRGYYKPREYGLRSCQVVFNFLDEDGGEIVLFERFDLLGMKKKSNVLDDRNMGRVKNDYIKIYPNPARDILQFEIREDLIAQLGNLENTEIEIYNTQGKSAYQSKLFINNLTNQQAYSINIANLSAGGYYLILKRGEEILAKAIFVVANK